MKKMSMGRRVTGIALFIMLLLAAAGASASSDYGMISDTIMWEWDGSGVITITGNGEIPDYARGQAPWNRYINKVTKVLFYGNIDRIGNYAFADGSRITYIAFPRTLKSVGKGAFSNCTVLASSEKAAQSWSVPSYEWSTDYKTLTATRVSNLYPSVVQTETVNANPPETISEPTCQKTGTVQYTAGGFKNSAFKAQAATEEIPTLEHTPVADEAVAPTCTEPGKTAGSHCGVCGAPIIVQEEIPPRHTLSYVESAESNCTEHGWKAHWHCSACGKDFADEAGETETDPTLPLSHNLTAHEGKEPTCTETGNIAWWECTECHKLFSDENAEHGITEEEIILPVKHHLVKWERIDPSCYDYSNGMESFWVCDVPGCMKPFYDPDGKNEILNMADVRIYYAHKMIHRPVMEATCTENGRSEEYWYCTECKRCYGDSDPQTKNEIEQPEEVKALDHDWGEPEYTWSKDLKTCTAMRVCNRNQDHVETENGTVTVRTTKEATTEAEGTAVCTATFTNEAFTTQTREKILTKLQPIKPAAGTYKDKATGTYEIKADGTAVFKKPAKAKTTVSIPDTIKVKGFDVPVTAIADKAFNKDSKLTTITIGNNVKTIGKNAFNGCAKLKTVKGGKKVETIKDSAFSGCVKLSALPAFSKLKTIGANAFKGCKALTKVTIGTSVKSIGKNAFNGCAALKTITIKSTLLTKNNVKSGAFKGIHAKATVKCPKKQLKDYRKFLPGKGVPKTATIK